MSNGDIVVEFHTSHDVFETMFGDEPSPGESREVSFDEAENVYVRFYAE